MTNPMNPFREGEFDDWGRHSCARTYAAAAQMHRSALTAFLKYWLLESMSPEPSSVKKFFEKYFSHNIFSKNIFRKVFFEKYFTSRSISILRPDRFQFYVQIDLNFTSRSTSILRPDRSQFYVQIDLNFTSRSTSSLRPDRPQFYVRFTCKLYVRASIPKLTKKFTRGRFATNPFIGYK